MTNVQYIRLGIFFCSLLLTALITSGYKNAVWQERLTQAQNEQLAEHNKQLQFILDKERKAQELATKMEVAYHDQVITVNALATDNRRLANELGGLRDPYAVRADSRNTASCAPCKPCDGKLSAEATKFLLELTEEADKLRAYATTCYQWISRNKKAH